MKNDLSYLLDFCEVETFKAGGKGGQHQNKTDSAVRIRHIPTGITVISRDDRSQYMNKKQCLEILKIRLDKLHEKPKPRIPTKVSRSDKRKRVESKVKTGVKKNFRKKPGLEED